MKKIFLILTSAALLFSACEKGDFGVKAADPQAYAQEDALVFPESMTATSVGTINLASAEDTVLVANVTEPTLPEGCTLTNACIHFTGENHEAEFRLIDGYRLEKEYIQDVMESCFGGTPTERTITAYISADVEKDGECSYIRSNNFDFKAIPEAPFISTGYYLIGTVNDWAVDASYPFEHSDQNVYDDPIFTMTVTLPADCWWKIAPKENVDAGTWDPVGEATILGVENNGDTSLSGSLVPGNPGAGEVLEAGKYILTINMMDYTYEFKSLTEYYLVGAVQDWSGLGSWKLTGDASYTCILYHESDGVFSYTGRFGGSENATYYGFKLFSSNIIDAQSGDWDSCLGGENDNEALESGNLVSNGGAICAIDNGYRKFTFNIASKTYTQEAVDTPTTEYTYISLIGGFNSWSGDTELTEVTPHNWMIRNFTLDSDTELKFRADHDWTVNWGWDGDNSGASVADVNAATLVGGGGNLVVPAGTYSFYLNDITGQFVVVAQ